MSRMRTAPMGIRKDGKSKSKRRSLKPYKRKVHIEGKEWTYEVKHRGYYLVIRNPELTQTWRVDVASSVLGVEPDEIGRAHWKGCTHCNMRPAIVKDWIEREILNMARPTELEASILRKMRTENAYEAWVTDDSTYGWVGDKFREFFSSEFMKFALRDGLIERKGQPFYAAINLNDDVDPELISIVRRLNDPLDRNPGEVVVKMIELYLTDAGRSWLDKRDKH